LLILPPRFTVDNDEAKTKDEKLARLRRASTAPVAEPDAIEIRASQQRDERLYEGSTFGTGPDHKRLSQNLVKRRL